MKKLISLMAMVSMVLLLLTSCGGGNVDQVKISDWEPSEIYTDEEIESAIQTVIDYFKRHFKDCTLTSICYEGDAAGEFDAWAKQHNADEAIVLYSSFDVGSSGGQGTLEPNTTYDNWNWILVRQSGGAWEHVDHGY